MAGLGTDLKVSTYDPGYSERWSELVRTSDEAWLLHTREFCDTCAQGFGMKECSLVASAGEGVLGILPLHVNASCSSLRSPGMGMGGPALVNGLSSAERQGILTSLIRAAEKEARRERCKSLMLYRNALAPKSRGAGAAGNLAGFGQPTLEATRVINLRRGYEALRAAFSKTAKQTIRKAIQAGVTIEEVAPAAALDEYYAIHVETYRRTGVSPHPREYFRLMFERVGGQGWLKLFRARRQGQTLAFLNAAWFKGAAWYWTGCSNSEGLKAGANYLLQASAIECACQEGLSLYEVGQVSPEATQGKIAGLTVFKTKFGGDLMQHAVWERPISKVFFGVRRQIGSVVRKLGLRR